MDNLSPDDRIKTMRAVKSKSTGVERTLRAMLAGMHLSGWRANASDLPGKPDVAFDRQKVALFVDGCFWHGCPICSRPLPVSHHEYWQAKIAANVARAERAETALTSDGWRFVRIWEHEIRRESTRKPVRSRLREELDKEEEAALSG
jgi:DNA mismatch endonuclease (patch repair protein)